VQREPWGKNQANFYSPGLLFDVTKYLAQAIAHSKNPATAKGEKNNSCPIKLTNPLPQKNNGPSIM